MKANEMDVDQCIRDLKHEDLFVRIHAAKNLKWIGDSRAIEPLIESLKNQNPGVRVQIVETLRGITNQDFGEDPAVWAKWYRENKGKLSGRSE